MANYLVTFSAPQHHIEFMIKHPGISRNYCAGEHPEIEVPEQKKKSFINRIFSRKSGVVESLSDTLTIPSDWPQKPADVVDIEINHRNVDLYHWILNKTAEPVKGAGSIFQTWFHNSHSAYSLDNYHEDFAFIPSQLPELLSLVEVVTPESLREAFHGWCKVKGTDHEPTIEDCEEMYKEFVAFGKYLKVAISKNHGLVWVVS